MTFNLRFIENGISGTWNVAISVFKPKVGAFYWASMSFQNLVRKIKNPA
jgi:hypothetical protein